MRPYALCGPLSPLGAAAEPVPRLEDAIRYLQRQRVWLGDYAAWHAAGYPVSSNLIERAVALIIYRRMKRQGMRCARPNASCVVALRVREFTVDWQDDDLLTLSAG